MGQQHRRVFAVLTVAFALFLASRLVVERRQLHAALQAQAERQAASKVALLRYRSHLVSRRAGQHRQPASVVSAQSDVSHR